MLANVIELARYLRNNNGRRAKDKRPGIWEIIFYRVGLISIFVYMKKIIICKGNNAF